MMYKKIYVASSWRCKYQQPVVHTLRAAKLDVYDFQDPEYGFNWNQIDPNWESWDLASYKNGLLHPLAQLGFQRDYEHLIGCDCVILVLPSGNSAHIEAAWAKGNGKVVFIYTPEKCKPDLMYKLFDGITDNMRDLLGFLGVED